MNYLGLQIKSTSLIIINCICIAWFCNTPNISLAMAKISGHATCPASVHNLASPLTPLVSSVVTSRFGYCISLSKMILPNLMCKRFRRFKIVTQAITDAPKHDQIRPLLQEFTLDTVVWLIKWLARLANHSIWNPC